jgi:phenylacetate-CoA ligase
MNWTFKWALIIGGFNIEKAKKSYFDLKNNHTNPKSVAWDQFNYFYRENAFYQNFLETKNYKNSDSWEDIPTITKKDFPKDLSCILTNWKYKDIHFHSTSGSSGTPFIFAKNKFCHAMTWAHIDSKLSEHGIDVGSSLQARFYGIPLGRLKYYKERFKDFLARRVRYSVFDLSEKQLEKVILDFKKIPFEYVNGYTNSLVIVSKYLINKKMSLVDFCPTLKCVITTSEICDEIDRAIIERGFGVKVVNEYGAADSDLIAIEDIDGDFVLNEETLFVEILNEDNKPVDFGEEGRVVCTSLFNKVMPFIRYEIGDLAVLRDMVKNGNRVLEKVIGRTNDLIQLPSGKTAPGFTLYYVVKEFIEKGSDISEYLIRQTAIDFFIFEYVAPKPISESEERTLMKIFQEYLEFSVKVSVKEVLIIERTLAGKRKHFISEIQ